DFAEVCISPPHAWQRPRFSRRESRKTANSAGRTLSQIQIHNSIRHPRPTTGLFARARSAGIDPCRRPAALASLPADEHGPMRKESIMPTAARVSLFCVLGLLSCGQTACNLVPRQELLQSQNRTKQLYEQNKALALERQSFANDNARLQQELGAAV